MTKMTIFEAASEFTGINGFSILTSDPYFYNDCIETFGKEEFEKALTIIRNKRKKFLLDLKESFMDHDLEC